MCTSRSRSTPRSRCPPQPPAVQALVSGRGRELLKLYSASPQLRRSVGMDDTVFAVHPADVFTSNEADVKVVDVRPHFVRLPLARVAPVAPRQRAEIASRDDARARHRDLVRRDVGRGARGQRRRRAAALARDPLAGHPSRVRRRGAGDRVARAPHEHRARGRARARRCECRRSTTSTSSP